MTFGLVDVGYSLPDGQAVKLIFFAPCKGLQRLYKGLQGYTRDLQRHGKVYVWVIGTKCEIKMSGYWPSSFFAWTKKKSRSINSQKTNKANIQPS